MKKSKYLLILSMMIILGVTGCASKEKDPNIEASETTSTIAPEGFQDVMNFKENENSKFSLYLKDYGFLDITEYVSDSTGRDIEISTKMLENVFGYTILTRADDKNNINKDSSDVYLEMQDEMNNLIQIQINGKAIIYNGNVFTTANIITGDKSEAKIKLNDFLFASGYRKIDQSLANNTLLTIAYKDETEPSIVIKLDEHGNIIESEPETISILETNENGEVIVQEDVVETSDIPAVNDTISESEVESEAPVNTPETSNEVENSTENNTEETTIPEA